MNIDIKMHTSLDDGARVAAALTNMMVGGVAAYAEEEGYELNDPEVSLTGEGKDGVLVTICLELVKEEED